MNGDRRLEQRLRQGRPEARSEFVDELAGQIEETGRSRAYRRLRLGLAAGLALALVALLASFGGYSYAASAVTSTKDAISKVVSSAGTKQTALNSQNASQAAARVTPSAFTYPAPTITSCTVTVVGNHWKVTVTGTSTDTNASDTITATFSPVTVPPSASTPGSASWTIFVNPITPAPTSVTVTQVNGGTSQASCTLTP
jgi:Flp pilus assembly protein TadG